MKESLAYLEEIIGFEKMLDEKLKRDSAKKGKIIHGKSAMLNHLELLREKIKEESSKV